MDDKLIEQFDIEEPMKGQSSKITWFQLIKDLFESAISCFVTYLLSGLLITINIHFSSYLEDRAILGGIGLAQTIQNATGGLLMIGLNMGYGSIASKAYGAKQYQVLGNYTSMALLQYVVTFIPISILFLSSHRILLAVGQDPEISYQASHFLISIMPGLASLFLMDVFKNLLNAQQRFNEPMIVGTSVLVMHFLISQLLVVKLQWGLSGIIYSMNISNLIGLILMMALAFFYTRRIPNFSIRFDQCKDFCNFYKQTIVIAIPTQLEALYWEFAAIFIGMLHDQGQFGAHVIISSFAYMAASCGFGISDAVCKMIGTAVGERDIYKLEKLKKLSYYFSFAAGCLVVAITQAFKHHIFYFYSNDEEVLEIIYVVWDMYCVATIFDYVGLTLGGVFKGIGKGNLFLNIDLFGYYVVGLPVGLVLGFYFGYGIYGFWFGNCAAVVALTLLSIYYLEKTNLQDQMQTSYKQLQVNEKEFST